MDLDNLAREIDHLAADPTALADAASVERLHRELARLDCLVTTVTAAFDSSGCWERDGARSAAAWIATRCRLPRRLARSQVRRARALRELPGCAAAWSAGEISAAHVDVVAGVRRDATKETLARDEELLLDGARELGFPAFTRTVAYWEQLADPDGVEDLALGHRERRGVFLVPGIGGTWLGRVSLDAIAGEIVADELARLESMLFDADVASARERLGRDGSRAELGRSPAQRRADALVEMATRSRAAHDDAPRPVPLFSVYVGYETLHGRICELASGTVVTPGSLVPYLDRAMVERAVFASPARVEIGTKARLFTGAVRRAIELRDRTCTHPYCDEPANRCQGDHVQPYSAGGMTTQENGRLLCGFHNRLRNERPPPAV